MGVPLVDLHIKFLVEHTIRTFRSDPERYAKEVFCDAMIDQHAVLYGQRMMNQVVDWIRQIEIPVVLGYDLDATQIPGVTIHLESSPVEKQFMGDAGFMGSMPLAPSEIPVIVKTFTPAAIELGSDGPYYIITLPADMTPEDRVLVLPGLRFRDKNDRLYNIGEFAGKPTAIPIDGQSSLQTADLSELTVISTYDDQQYRQGVMYYTENVLITVHGHSDRQEGLWLWAIVQWGLLKFRPILTATFGLDLATPQASDFAKDDQFLGTNIWRRFITLGAKAVWSWQSAKQEDLLGFLLDLNAQVSGDIGSDNGTDINTSTTPPTRKPKPVKTCGP